MLTTTNKIELELQWSDFGVLIWFFMVIVAIRALMMLLCFPLLQNIGYSTNLKDAGFMVWAGLRGAVGVSLAILVQNGGDKRAGQQVMFLTSGLAFLTLIVSGTSAGIILRAAGMLKGPEVKLVMVKKVQERVKKNSEIEYRKTVGVHGHEAHEAIKYMSNLRHLVPVDDGHVLDGSKPDHGHSKAKNHHNRGKGRRRNVICKDAEYPNEPTPDDQTQGLSKDKVQPQTLKIIPDTRDDDVDNSYNTSIQSARRQPLSPNSREPYTLEYLARIQVDSSRCRSQETAILRETFYNILKSEYWHMIEQGHLPRDNPASLILLNAVDLALDNCNRPLNDWKIVEKSINESIDGCSAQWVEKLADSADKFLPDSWLFDNEVHYHFVFKKVEKIYYICQGFREAHATAELKLATFFGDRADPDTPEEKVRSLRWSFSPTARAVGVCAIAETCRNIDTEQNL